MIFVRFAHLVTCDYSIEQEEAVAKGCAFQCELLSDPARSGVFAKASVSMYPVAVRIFTWLDTTSGETCLEAQVS